jgi:6-phosphogluconolactonase
MDSEMKEISTTSSAPGSGTNPVSNTQTARAGSDRLLVFVGSYAEEEGPGIYLYELNEEKEELSLLDQVSGLKNPTFLNVDAARLKLYSIAEGVSDDGQKTGDVAVFAIEPAEGKLQFIKRSRAVDAPTCHIQRDADNRYLLVASYHGGSIGLVGLQKDGNVGGRLDAVQHEGGSVHARQDRPHPHSVFFSPDQRYLFVPDLGLDRIRAYTIDPEGKLRFHGDTPTQPGAGPRHLAFHPNGKFAFVINEIDSTINSYQYDANAGTLQWIETVPTLPVDAGPIENTCAEISVSEDGRYLYGSNRGHDSIVVYRIDAETGRLTYVEHVSTEGQHPRHFALMPGGRLLLAANRDTNNLVLFRVDPESGKLTFTGKTVNASKPVCVQAARFTVRP